MLDKIRQDLHKYFFAIIGVFVCIAFNQIVLGTVCPIKAIFNVECPGCGITHAFYYLITGNIQAAIEANYTVFAWIFFILLFLFDRYIHKFKTKIVPCMFGFLIIFTLIRYVINIFSF